MTKRSTAKTFALYFIGLPLLFVLIVAAVAISGGTSPSDYHTMEDYPTVTEACKMIERLGVSVLSVGQAGGDGQFLRELIFVVDSYTGRFNRGDYAGLDGAISHRELQLAAWHRAMLAAIGDENVQRLIWIDTEETENGREVRVISTCVGQAFSDWPIDEADVLDYLRSNTRYGVVYVRWEGEIKETYGPLYCLSNDCNIAAEWARLLAYDVRKPRVECDENVCPIDL